MKTERKRRVGQGERERVRRVKGHGEMSFLWECFT